MDPTYTYQLLPHAGVTHLVLNGRNYQLNKLTEADMALLYGKTTFIKRTVVRVPRARTAAK